LRKQPQTTSVSVVSPFLTPHSTACHGVIVIIFAVIFNYCVWRVMVDYYKTKSPTNILCTIVTRQVLAFPARCVVS